MFDVLSFLAMMSDLPAMSTIGDSFEGLSKANGGTYWYAADLMRLLGYTSQSAFAKATNRAIGTCTTLNISVSENFLQSQDGNPGDTRLSRFACYLVAMNGDTQKPQVAAAQAYFAAMADAVQQLVGGSDNVERVQIRDDVSDREKSLSGVARGAGIIKERYGLFHNAGYRGMYNMDYRRLRERKGVDSSRSLLDFMGKQELAANLFRLTETEAKIRKGGVRGQSQLENAATEVGSKVRGTMIETSGTYPEDLPVAEDIKTVKKGLKRARRELQRLDKPKKKPLSPQKKSD